MSNLYEETVEVLEFHGKSINDIRWIGTKDCKYDITVDDLRKIFDFEYDDGYGIQEINRNLIIVGDGWWLERHQYDGSEWWEFKMLPKEPEKTIVPLHGHIIDSDFTC